MYKSLSRRCDNPGWKRGRYLDVQYSLFRVFTNEIKDFDLKINLSQVSRIPDHDG